MGQDKTKQDILEILRGLFIITDEVREKIVDGIDTFSDEKLEIIGRLLQKAYHKQHQLLTAYIEKHPDFLSEFTHFLQTQIKGQTEEQEVQSKKEDEATLQELESSINALL